MTMAEWTIAKRHDDGWHECDVCRDGDLLIYARWRQHGENAELHNEIFEASKSVLVKAREMFQEIKQDMRAAGCKRVVALSDRFDDKMGRYWRFMGFEYFTVEYGIQCAVMGVDDGTA